jgi:hypothetical protein
MKPIVSHLQESRDIAVPTQDEAPLKDHWSKMRRLRGQVDESRLADAEIAVTWSPAGDQNA